MNKAERIAFSHLSDLGIKVKDNTNFGSPDFLGEKHNYEVKKLVGSRSLVFTKFQLPKMKNAIVIVVQENKIVDKIPFSLLENKYSLTTVDTDFFALIKIPFQTREDLKAIGYKSETYGKIISRLLANDASCTCGASARRVSPQGDGSGSSSGVGARLIEKNLEKEGWK